MEEKLAKLGEKAHQVVVICPKDTREVQGRHAEITAMWNKLKVCLSSQCCAYIHDRYVADVGSSLQCSVGFFAVTDTPL